MLYKAGLILEGGATRGIFSSGVLDFLIEKDVNFSYVIGVSAGSCNAVDFVSRQFDRTRHCFMPEKENDYMSLETIIKKHSIFDMDKIFDAYPNGIYPFDFKTFFESDAVCEIVATNVRTGKPEYFQEKEDKERLMQICRASSSMPLLTPMVHLDHQLYVDGGVSDSIPIKRAIDMGCEKNVVILTRNRGYRKKRSESQERLWNHWFRNFPKLAEALDQRYRMYNKEMNRVERLEKEGKIFVIRPEIPTISHTERHPEKLMEFYRHGYISMMKQYDALMEYLRNYR